MSSLVPFEWASPDVDVAGVVDVEDPTAEEFKVEEDLRRSTRVPFWPPGRPLTVAVCFSSGPRYQ